MRAKFDKPSDSHAKYYSLTEHLAVDEIVLFRGRIIFKQHIPKKYKWFGMKLCKLYDPKGYTRSVQIVSGLEL